MKLKEVPYYKSSIVLGEEVRLGQLARYDLSLLACLSHIALGCAIQHERHWCHSLIEGWIPPSAYSSHLVPLYYQPRWSLAGFIFCDCCPNVRGGKERLLLLNAPIHSHRLLLLSRAQLCLTLCEPRDYRLPGSSVHKISQTRILEWVAISSSRGSSWLSDRNCVSCVSCGGRRILYQHATWEALTGLPEQMRRTRKCIQIVGKEVRWLGPSCWDRKWETAPQIKLANSRGFRDESQIPSGNGENLFPA